MLALCSRRRLSSIRLISTILEAPGQHEITLGNSHDLANIKTCLAGSPWAIDHECARCLCLPGNDIIQSYRELLAIADLPSVLAATVLARFAGRMLSLAIILYALNRFASPELAGWLSFAAVAPGLMVSPLAGALLDRIGSVRAITVDMAFSALLIVAMIGADRLGSATPSLLLVLVALFSLTSPLSVAGVRALLPRLVPAQALDRVNALDTAIFAVADIGGPALAGVLIGWAGAGPTLAVIALTYATAALCIAGVGRTWAVAAGRGSMARDALDGIRAVLLQPTLRGLAVSYALYQVTWGVLTIVVPVCLVRSLSPESANAAAGLLWAGVGVAGGLGALIAGQLRTAGRERLVMAWGMGLTALAAWPVGVAFGISGLVAGLLVAGLVAGPIDVGLLTLRQRRTDPGQLGRVLSVSISLNIAGFPVGAALGGMLVERSLPVAFAAAGLTAVLAAAAIRLIPREIA
jgi:predicted MFS family arabinose efflux permease